MHVNLQLLLRMADLWIAHIEAATKERPNDPEIQDELMDMVALRNQVMQVDKTDTGNIDRFTEITQAIEEYLQVHDPECMPVSLRRWKGDQKRLLLTSAIPISLSASLGLDEEWPGLIVTEQMPRADPVS